MSTVYSGFDKIARPLTFIFKTSISTKSLKKFPTSVAVKKDKIESSSGNSRTNEIDKISAKSENIKNLLKAKKSAKA